MTSIYPAPFSFLQRQKVRLDFSTGQIIMHGQTIPLHTPAGIKELPAVQHKVQMDGNKGPLDPIHPAQLCQTIRGPDRLKKKITIPLSSSVVTTLVCPAMRYLAGKVYGVACKSQANSAVPNLSVAETSIVSTRAGQFLEGLDN